MADLIGAFLVLAFFSGALAILAFRISLKARSVVRAGLIGTFCVALIAYFPFGQDSLWFAHLLPIPEIPILACLSLPLAAAIAGVLAASLPPSRRYGLPSLVVIVALVQIIHTFVGRAPATHRGVRIKGVVMQSSDASCGAASAATLLQARSIAANEPEMVRLCGTHNDGTAMLGIYRGLVLNTRDTPYRVGTMVAGDAATLRRTSESDGPVLIAVGLPRFSLRKVDPRYEAEWGWTPGLKHAVVFFGALPNGKIDIGDPSTGRESWDWRALDVPWDGQGIYLHKNGQSVAR